MCEFKNILYNGLGKLVKVFSTKRLLGRSKAAKTCFITDYISSLKPLNPQLQNPNHLSHPSPKLPKPKLADSFSGRVERILRSGGSPTLVPSKFHRPPPPPPTTPPNNKNAKSEAAKGTTTYTTDYKRFHVPQARHG